MTSTEDLRGRRRGSPQLQDDCGVSSRGRFQGGLIADLRTISSTNLVGLISLSRRSAWTLVETKGA